MIMLPIHPIIQEDVRSIVAEDKIHWEKLRNKTVLVTGASGLIGSYLVYTMLCQNEMRGLGITVLGLVRNRDKAEKQFSPLLDRPDFQLLVQDVTAPIVYEGEVQYIFHAASQASPKYFIKDPVGTIAANTTGTLNLLEFARVKGAEGFLYLSSREIYGEPINEKRFTSEDEYGVVDPTLVRSCYPESKRMSENLCACYTHQYSVPSRIIRLAHVYGPDYMIDNGRVWGDFVMNVVRGEDIVLKSEGLMELAFTYVSDAVSGIFFALLNGNELVYNIGTSSEIIRVRDLAEMVAGLYPDKGVKVVYDIPTGVTGYLANRVAFLDATKVKTIGWQEKINLNEGISRVICYESNLS